MSKLLINEPPLQVLPSLAKAIGLNEAIALQQVHYHEGRIGQLRDGRCWFRRSIAEWQRDFPFWSERTIRRTFEALSQLKLMAIGEFNLDGGDRTNWYSIEREELQKHEDRLTASHEEVRLTSSIKGSYQRVDSPAQETEGLTDVKAAYERWVGPMTPLLVDAMRETVAHYNPDWIVEALELTQARHMQDKTIKPSWSYAMGIVRSWVEKGYDGKNGAVALTDIDRKNLAALGIES